MIFVLYRPTCLARYIAICRLKQAGCEFPSPRVGPKRTDTAASISASGTLRPEISLGANDVLAIYAPFLASATAGCTSK
jgi:hypothetical protein